MNEPNISELNLIAQPDNKLRVVAVLFDIYFLLRGHNV